MLGDIFVRLDNIQKPFLDHYTVRNKVSLPAVQAKCWSNEMAEISLCSRIG